MDNDTASPALIDVAGLIPTLAPAGNIVGPSCRVGVTSGQVTVLAIGSGQAGFDLAGLDALRAALDTARVRMATPPGWGNTEWTPPGRNKEEPMKSQDAQLSLGQVTVHAWPDGAQRLTVYGWAVQATVHPESLGVQWITVTDALTDQVRTTATVYDGRDATNRTALALLGVIAKHDGVVLINPVTG